MSKHAFRNLHCGKRKHSRGKNERKKEIVEKDECLFVLKEGYWSMIENDSSNFAEDKKN